MIKNKTHRIISISPSSQHSSSIKNGNNKTVTPIKPIQHPTRMNTIKTNTKPDSLVIDQTCTKQPNNENVIESVFVSSYKQEGQCVPKRDSWNIDEILHRIGKTYEGKSSSASAQLYKKTQISQLRQTIRQAKQLVKCKQQSHSDPFGYEHNQSSQIESLSLALREQISTMFAFLHKELKIKQKSLYEELDLKIFQLKDKNTMKCFQISSLKSYLQKCQKDVNSNYEGIIQQLEIKQLTKIVDSYVEKIQFYINMVKAQYTLKLELPKEIQQFSWLQNVKISLGKQQEPILQQVEAGSNHHRHDHSDLNSSKIDERKFSFDKKKTKKAMDGHTKNIKSAFEEVQNFPINKIIMKKIHRQDQNQPRISSARGRY